MATADTSLPMNAAAPTAKVPMMTMLACCVGTVLLAVGGTVAAMMFLAKSGKLIGGPVAQPPTVEKKNGEVATHPKVLEPMLINLADEDGRAYIWMGVVLAVEDAPGPKPKEEVKGVAGADAAVRDTIFDVMGRQTSAGLLAPEGKTKLKTELLTALGKRNPELKVTAIYFSDFLVQR